MVLFSISTRWFVLSVVTKSFLFGIVEYIDWINILSQLLFFRCSLSGVSPFQGETVEETCRRITDVNYEFNPKHFDPISQQAKDFITALLVKNPKWVKAHSKLFFSLFFFLPVFLPFLSKARHIAGPYGPPYGNLCKSFMNWLPQISILVHRASVLLVSVRDRFLTLTKRIEALGTRMSNFALKRPSLAGGFHDKTGLWHFRSFNLVPRVFLPSKRNPANSPVHACAFW